MDEGDDWRAWRGDALSILPSIPTASADLVLCDPPYNIGLAYDASGDDLTPDDYLLWCATWFRECKRVARKHVVVFPGVAYFPMWLKHLPLPTGIGYWNKPGNPGGGGVFKYCETEPWLVWGKWFGGSDTITATLVSCGQKDTGSHPCPKPPRLYSELFKRLRPTSVLDPMMGSGTAGVASLKYGATFMGIEIAESYYDTAVSRMRFAAGEEFSQLTRPDLFTELGSGHSPETAVEPAPARIELFS